MAGGENGSFRIEWMRPVASNGASANHNNIKLNPVFRGML
jgi:hypothetical protein